MFSIAHLLQKTVVRKFYERNTGFFLFIFFFMFGIVESTQIVNYHLSLIYGLLQSPLFLSLVCILWIGYMTKCFLFASGFFTSGENSFLLTLNRLSYSKRIACLLYVFLLIDLPVMIYVVLIMVVAIRKEFYGIAAFIISFQFFIMVLAAGALERQLSSLTAISQRPLIKITGPVPFSFYYLGCLLHRHKIVLFLTKAFSFFAIIGFLHIPLDHVEYRTAILGLLFGIAAHAVIVFEFRKFEENDLPFLRNLPIPVPKRFAQLALVYLLLMFPETILLVVNHQDILTVFGIYLFSTGLLILSHCRLYVEINNDKHIQFTLGLFLISFMLVLFKIYLAELFVIWMLAYYYFKKHFYQFELHPD